MCRFCREGGIGDKDGNVAESKSCKNLKVWGCCGLVTQLCKTLCDTLNYNQPGSSTHGIHGREYWSGLPFPSPGDLPGPGIEPTSPAWQAASLLLSHPGSPFSNRTTTLILPSTECLLCWHILVQTKVFSVNPDVSFLVGEFPL